MIDRILPAVVDNRFAGHGAAIWLLALFVAVRLLMSISMIANPRSVARGPDGIPIDSFAEAAASRFLAIFTMLGICQLALATLGLVVLLRYRSLIPFIYLVFLGELAARRMVVLARPLADQGHRPFGFYFNLLLVALLLVGLVLSLRSPA